MSKSRSVIEDQLKKSTEDLEARRELLNNKKLNLKQIKKDPVFRMLEAKVYQNKFRLKAITTIENLNAKLVEEKAKKLAQPKVDKKQKGKKAPPKKESGKSKKSAKKPKK